MVAQGESQPAATPTAPAVLPGQQDASSESWVDLNLPEDLELVALVDLVSQRLGINILYDEQVRGRTVTIKSPTRVPKGSLLGLLQSALRMKGLTLVDDDQQGWKRIVPAQDLVAISPTAPVDPAAPVLLPAVTRVFEVEHVPVKRADDLVRPFLSKPGGNTLSIEEQGLLIVTDFASHLQRIENVLALVDRPVEPAAVRFIPVEHLPAVELSQKLQEVLNAQRQRSGGEAVKEAGTAAQVTADERTNQLILVGTAADLEHALSLVESLDVPLGLLTMHYQLRSVSPERIETIARQLIDPRDAERQYRATIDAESGLLVVTTTSALHKQIAELIEQLDRPTQAGQSPIRFYKLANAKAIDVLAVLQALAGGGERQGVVQPAAGMPRNTTGRTLQGVNPIAPLRSEGGIEQPNRASSLRDAASATPFAPTPGSDTPGSVADITPGVDASSVSANSTIITPSIAGLPFTATPTGAALDLGASVGEALASQRARVAADPSTNTILVIAEPAVQQVFEYLIRTLDERRPQVMIEVTLVTVDTSNNFSLGVEVLAGDRTGDNQSFAFSSFGLSQVGDDGRLQVLPGLGFNGAVLTADIADVIIRALKANNRARVVSAPKLLVNDNATGTLSGVSEAPFVQINQGQTTDTTSFGGFVEAGTTITVTPSISQADHIVLEYELNVSSFSGEAGDGIPPPRQTNTITSTVTVPDGHMVIVGGLNRVNTSEGKQGVPLLGDIPLLGAAFSSQSQTESTSTLFAFIRPVILRDDEFRGLKYLSSTQQQEAGLPDAFPLSEPLLVR